MKTGLFITSLLAAVVTASPATADDPPPNGSMMAQYCDGENMQGPCTNLDDSNRMHCVRTVHGTASIKVFDGFACSMFLSGGCSASGEKTWMAGTYNSINSAWNESSAIDCFSK
ncbi:hypothetical protein PG984_011857 [Apiospora sp. TS-2023a]